jgi:uncharacterized protein (TIGR02186 family)
MAGRSRTQAWLASTLASALASGLLLWPALPARAEELVASLSTHRVLIGSNYTGAQIAVFGSVEREGRSVGRADPYDIIVTVIGPRRQVVVREKSQHGLLWLNDAQRKFADAPSFLASMTNRTMAEMGSAEDARRLQVGLRNRLLPTTSAAAADPGLLRFVDALIRLKTEDKLYQEIERGVTFLTPSLFRSNIVLPATAPTGNYEVVVELVSGSVSLARQQTSFEVVQIGFEQRVAWVARNWSLTYGLMTAVMALIFGWLATVIFRRD